jgi:hypothetical protein
MTYEYYAVSWQLYCLPDDGADALLRLATARGLMSHYS